MKIETSCPDCGQAPVERLELIDGEIWICPGCGYLEVSAGVDIEAQLGALGEYDPDLAEGWREAIGI